VRLISIYRCLCDETRLRILNLISVSPLCVCHIQKVLGKHQVTVSQHLAYLRERKMVAVQRYRNWMIYSAHPLPSPELEANLKCLQDCVASEPVFMRDRKKLARLMGDRSVRALLDEGCCAVPVSTIQPGRVPGRRLTNNPKPKECL
jgi:ArsR family transcriptional regulator